MVTLVCGPNGFLKRHKLAMIIGDFSRQYAQQAIERYDGESLEPSRLPEIFQGQSLFALNKLIIIRGAAAQKSLWEALEPFAGTNDETTRIVLLEGEPDKRTKTFKTLQKHGEVVECKEPSAGELISWVVGQSAGRLTRPLATELVRRVGTDQQRLANELDKVLVHDTISQQHIEALVVPPSSEGTAFELLDAVLAGQREKVNAGIDNLAGSEDPYRFFALLVSNVQVLAALVADTTKTPQQVAKDLGANPYVVSKLSYHRRQTSAAKLQHTIGVLADTDVAMKSTGHDPWVLVRAALTKIAAH